MFIIRHHKTGFLYCSVCRRCLLTLCVPCFICSLLIEISIRIIAITLGATIQLIHNVNCHYVYFLISLRSHFLLEYFLLVLPCFFLTSKTFFWCFAWIIFQCLEKQTKKTCRHAFSLHHIHTVLLVQRQI